MSRLSIHKVFFLYPVSSDRRKYNEPNNYFSGRRYALYGKDKSTEYGIEPMDDFDICENIETSKSGVVINRLINKIVVSIGGYGGDWYKVFKLRSKFKRCDIIFSVTDRIGIPLIILMALRLILAMKRKRTEKRMSLRKRLAKYMKRYFSERKTGILS